MRDDLRAWSRVRASIAWEGAAEPTPGPVIGIRDGIASHVDTVVRKRDPIGANHLLAALARARADARAGAALSFDRLSGWHAVAMGGGLPPLAFRQATAYAPYGPERYGFDPSVPGRFDDAMVESCVDATPLAARAARAYLDVCYFHPFWDGNSRAATLAFYFLLARDGVFVDEAGPVLVATRRPGDPRLARALVAAVERVITATRARSQAG